MNMKRNRLREAGASPARSRHCKGDCPCTNATVQNKLDGKAQGQEEPKPGDLPVIRQSHCSTRDREVVFCLGELRRRYPSPGRAGVF